MNINIDFSLVHKLRQEKKTWKEIMKLVPNASNNMRKYYNAWLLSTNTEKLWLLPESRKPKDRVVGVVGDVHLPFEHPNYLQFIVDTFIEQKVTDIVFIGDLIDNHAISRHETSTRADSPLLEYYKTLEKIKEWKKEFPIAKMCIGNHDTIPERQISTLGIPSVFLKDYRTLWELPKEWEIEDYFTINDVLYIHGIGSGGKDGAINTALKQRLSLVQGHTHSYLGCKYMANARDVIFGLNVGCGIDLKAYAMEYGKYFVNKPTLGCGVVKGCEEAYAIPMGRKYFRSY